MLPLHVEGIDSTHGENRAMIFREMTQQDVRFMKDNSVSRGILKRQPEQMEFTYALEHEGNLLGIGGIRLINLTTAWCWVDMTSIAGEHIIIVYRVIKEWMEKLVEEKELKRLQAYIELDFPEAIRMAQHLGFEKESILEGFLPSGDAFLYRRLF